MVVITVYYVPNNRHLHPLVHLGDANNTFPSDKQSNMTQSEPNFKYSLQALGFRVSVSHENILKCFTFSSVCAEPWNLLFIHLAVI